MWFRTLFGYSKPNIASATRRRRAMGVRSFRDRLRIELLEDRSLPSNYTFTDLGTLGGATSSASDVNTSGQVVGKAENASGLAHAFIWTDGVMNDLGTLGGQGGWSLSGARAINDHGQVVGWAYKASNVSHAFLITPEDTDADGTPDRWYRDTNADGANDLMSDLGTLAGMQFSNALDINEAGQVIGQSNNAAGASRSYLWQNGTMTDLGTLSVSAINDVGQVVGSVPVPNSDSRQVVLWQNGTMTDLGQGYPTDINAAGQVVGYLGTYDSVGFLWTPTTPNGTVGTFTELPPLTDSSPGPDIWSLPSSINNSGVVAGTSRFEDNPVDGNPFLIVRSVIWLDGAPQDLNNDTYAWNSTLAINDAGQIVGESYGFHAYLLTPNSTGLPQLRIGNVTVLEGNSGTQAANFTVTLSSASDQPVTVAYATAYGTATAGSDYQAASDTLTFAPGETSKTISVPVNGDRLGEANETFFVNLSRPTNATIFHVQGISTIVDDEPRISISDVTRAEGKNRQTTLFVFTVTLSMAYDQPVTMSFATANGTATTSNSDYVARSGTLTFAPGETTKTITIEVKGDSRREANENFYLDLYGLSSNALFTKNRGIGTILNDD